MDRTVEVFTLVGSMCVKSCGGPPTHPGGWGGPFRILTFSGQLSNLLGENLCGIVIGLQQSWTKVGLANVVIRAGPSSDRALVY